MYRNNVLSASKRFFSIIILNDFNSMTLIFFYEYNKRKYFGYPLKATDKDTAYKNRSYCFKNSIDKPPTSEGIFNSKDKKSYSKIIYNIRGTYLFQVPPYL